LGTDRWKLPIPSMEMEENVGKYSSPTSFNTTLYNPFAYPTVKATTTYTMIKIVAVLFSLMAVAAAFAPMPSGRASTVLQKSFFDTVSLSIKVRFLRCTLEKSI
jgi:hypothetical protein